MFPTEPVPERIGSYKVIRRVAGAGSADVYLGRLEGPMGFERVCALKLVDTSIEGDVRFAEELAREASICAKLNHPAVVRMFDFFEYERRLVLVLEHVDGADLERLIQHLARRRQRLSDDAIWYIGHQLCGALGHAHAATDEEGNSTPVIHRNLQPENVLIAWDGQVRLAGFGLGKVLGRTPDTVVGLIKGTPGYMAPEQARGERVTPRVDVYLVGLLLWSLLSGQRPPLDGTRPQSIGQLRNDVPREIAAAIDAALEPSPDRRKISCQDIEQWISKVGKLDAGRNDLREKVLLLRSVRLPHPVTRARVGTDAPGAPEGTESRRPPAPRRRVPVRNARPSQRPPGPGPLTAPTKSSRPPRGTGAPPAAAAPNSELGAALRHPWRAPRDEMASVDALLDARPTARRAPDPTAEMSSAETVRPGGPPPLPPPAAPPPPTANRTASGERNGAASRAPHARRAVDAIPATAAWRDAGSDGSIPTRGFAAAVPLEPERAAPRPLSALASLGIATTTAAVVVAVGIFVAARELRPAPIATQANAPTAAAAVTPPSRATPRVPTVASAPVTTPRQAVEHAAASVRDPTLLPSGEGLLTVMFSQKADVYLNGRAMGPANQTLEVRCGRWFLRLGNPTDSGVPEWNTKGETVVVPCQGSVALTMQPTPPPKRPQP